MEIFIIWFVTFVATGEMIKDNQAELLIAQHRTHVLEENYQSLAGKHNLLAARHSAYVAGQNLKDEKRDANLDLLNNRVDRLQKDIKKPIPSPLKVD
tara:strand:+ start:203 stop:493 length:291 start_codon:yes stop_codon:yes gene_type:complete